MSKLLLVKMCSREEYEDQKEYLELHIELARLEGKKANDELYQTYQKLKNLRDESVSNIKTISKGVDVLNNNLPKIVALTDKSLPMSKDLVKPYFELEVEMFRCVRAASTLPPDFSIEEQSTKIQVALEKLDEVKARLIKMKSTLGMQLKFRSLMKLNEENIPMVMNHCTEGMEEDSVDSICIDGAAVAMNGDEENGDLMSFDETVVASSTPL